MPIASDHQHDPDRERAYRRGYAHGISSMMSGVVDKLSDAERTRFERWFSKTLTAWQTGDVSQHISPPDFPRLDIDA